MLLEVASESGNPFRWHTRRNSRSRSSHAELLRKSPRETFDFRCAHPQTMIGHRTSIGGRRLDAVQPVHSRFDAFPAALSRKLAGVPDASGSTGKQIGIERKNNFGA